MSGSRAQRNRRTRRGAAAVEFGLLLLPLSLILLGIVDYGWAFMQAAQVTNAAREGARAEAVGDDGQAAVDQYMSDAGMTGTYTVNMSTTIDRVEVQVSYDFQPLVGFVPTPPQLNAQVTMRLEGAP